MKGWGKSPPAATREGPARQTTGASKPNCPAHREACGLVGAAPLKRSPGETPEMDGGIEQNPAYGTAQNPLLPGGNYRKDSQKSG
ncbi:MAG: hypothetical protein LC751_05620, partial [Actinobacteria bacterium]|nr:hypothetical protein [Actinomycetota bacterium]